MKILYGPAWAGIALPLIWCGTIIGDDGPPLATGLLGGIRTVTAHDLETMQAGEYVLHARDGLLSKVPAEKSRLPHDPEGHVQRVAVLQAPGGTLFVKQYTILCKSADGGKTWSSAPIVRSQCDALWQVRSDGTFVAVGGGGWGKSDAPLPVMISKDQGQTWQQISEIRLPGHYNERYGYALTRLPDGVLLCGVSCRDHLEQEGGKLISGAVTLNAYRSEDGGTTWTGPTPVADWAHEGGIARTASGKLLAALRYQRPRIPGDPPDILERTGGRPFPYKHIFLAESTDGGKSWGNLRQLTTVFGQCYGYPAALGDGTVVVVHDCRYGPGVPSGRAMISRDEGNRWEDEAYYLYYGAGTSGYSQSVVLEDDLILTVAGTCDEPAAKHTWDAAVGHSVLTAIRWKPVKPGPRRPVDLSGARAARRKALARQRRVIFNDDTHELSRQDANTPEGTLKRRLVPLVGTHVDVISWSVLGGWADAPVYDSKVQPIYGDAHGGPPSYWPKVTENVKAIIKTGRCPLEIAVEFAHGNGMELFASVRMNDCHDSFIPGGVTLWKKQHPEFLVDTTGIPHDKDGHPLGLYVTAQDFSHEEVRDRKFEIIKEVCRRYDVDGIDLNYIRHPVFFSPTMQGEPVTPEQVEIMTRLMRRIRPLADEQGTRRGRPILVAAIVPDNFELALNVGLDVRTWIKEDLVDIVIPGLGYAPFSLPVKEFTDLARQYGVKVYPCINRKAPQHVSDEAISEGFRGVATNWYRAGADGIFFWNLGTPFEDKTGEELIQIRSKYYLVLPELGDPRLLEGKNKLFCVDDPVLSYYRHVSSRPPLPVPLRPGLPARIPFTVGDDLRTAASQGRLAGSTLTLKFDGPASEDHLALRINGRPLGSGRIERDGETQIDYHDVAPLVHQGPNVLEASLARANGDENHSLMLTQLRLWVRYGKSDH